MRVAIERISRGPVKPRARARLRLVSDPRAGDRTFEELHARFGMDIRRFVARRVRDPDLVDDIVQETFLRAYRARGSFDPDRPHWPWLVTIARNLIVNSYRDEQRGRALIRSAVRLEDLEAHPDTRDEVDPERRYVAGQRREAIATALGRLQPRARRMLLMRSIDHLGYKEIAAVEGVSVEALKSVVKRARRTFRENYRSITEEHGIPVVAITLVERLRWRARKLSLDARHRTNALGDFRLTQPVGEAIAAALFVAAAAGAIFIATQPRQEDAGSNPPPTAGSVSVTPGGWTADVPELQTATHRRSESNADRDRFLVAVSGRVDRERPDRRTVEMRIGYDAPGDEREEQVGLEIPCESFGPDERVCDAIDAASSALGDT